MFKKIMITLLSVFLLIALAVVGYGAKVYYDVKKTAQKIESPLPTSGKEGAQKVPVKGEPFAVMLLGIDTGELGRVEQGRSDSVLVATVNPKKNKTTMVSIPRDTYTEIVGHGTKDKINHAYAFGGVQMAKDSVANLLGIDINHYVSIDMKGLENLVDSVGGITIDNKLPFSYEGKDYPEGVLKMTGEQALGYSRMRYDDPNGDYGRQQRQQLVIKGIVEKAMSVSTITGYQDILGSISDSMKTDLSWEDLVTISKKYRSAFGNVEQDVLKGEGEMIDGVSYQMTSPAELTRIQSLLKEELK